MMARRPKRQSATQKVKMWKPDETSAHPINNQRNAEKLLQHLKPRLLAAKMVRDSRAKKWENIDKDVAGFHELTGDDLDRYRDRMLGKNLKPTEVVLPLADVQLEDFQTYGLSVLAPDETMFEAIAERDKMSVAKGFAMDLNRSARFFDYYSELGSFISSAMRYNLAHMEAEWTRVEGKKITTNEAGGTELIDGVVWSGNSITALDTYNTLLDPGVSPIKCARQGEFAAKVELFDRFQLERMDEDEVFWGVDRLIGDDKKLVAANMDDRLYYTHPIVRGKHESNVPQTQGQRTNWRYILSGDAGTSAGMTAEIVTIWIWLRPQEFNLGISDKLTLCKVVVANGQHIFAAHPLKNAHGLLPVVTTVPRYDNMGDQTKSYAEHLVPLQVFASFLLNLHVQASRKKLFGIVIYDPTKLPLGQITDQVSGYVACDPSGYNSDLRSAYVRISDAPDTDSIMNDLSSIIALMQTLLPTDQLRQVTDLQRATQYQAAATVYASNKKPFKILRMIDQQALSGLRLILMYNTMQFREDMEIIDSQGNLVKINPSAYRDAHLEFAVSDGLKGIDKLSLTSSLKDIINSIIQSQQAIRDVDIVALLNYYTSLIGDKTDLSQFRKDVPDLSEFGEMLASNPQTAELANTILPMIQGIYQNAKADVRPAEANADTLPVSDPTAVQQGGIQSA